MGCLTAPPSGNLGPSHHRLVTGDHFTGFLPTSRADVDLLPDPPRRRKPPPRAHPKEVLPMRSLTTHRRNGCFATAMVLTVLFAASLTAQEARETSKPTALPTPDALTVTPADFDIVGADNVQR